MYYFIYRDFKDQTGNMTYLKFVPENSQNKLGHMEYGEITNSLLLFIKTVLKNKELCVCVWILDVKGGVI